MIDVFVVASVRLMRDGLRHALDETVTLRVAATAAHCEELADRIAAASLAPEPPVLLLDVAGGAGAGELALITARAPGFRVVVLGVDDSDAAILSYLERGVVGYLTRDGSIAELVATVEEVARGELSCPPRITAGLIRRFGSLAAERGRARSASVLTEREMEILGLISRGLSNKEIAARLYIALATVKNHVHNMLDKLEVRTRADAAAWYGLSRAGLRAADRPH